MYLSHIFKLEDLNEKNDPKHLNSSMTYIHRTEDSNVRISFPFLLCVSQGLNSGRGTLASTFT